MDRIRSLQDLEQARTVALNEQATELERSPIEIRVSLGSCGIAAGAQETLEAVRQLVDARDGKGIQWKVIGCTGMCALEPIVQVFETNQAPVTYGKVFPAVVKRIFSEHVEKHLVVQEYMVENL